uniref:WRKY19-like zinc finger domain-containing protein n=1 Tax=Peronospora matthiolae TaxID=2874970 RepID=A0AAV1TAA4_9STRA
MGPTTARHTLAELQFPSFLTQLKAPGALEAPMRVEPQWASSASSPTSITSNPTNGSSLTTTSQPLPSFTLDQQSSSYGYGSSNSNSSSSAITTISTTHVPFRPPMGSLSTPTGYYTQHLLPPRDGPPFTSSSAASAASASSSTWSGPNYTSDTSVVFGDYAPQHLPPPPPPPPAPAPPAAALASQVVLHPLVLQHSEPLPRSNDDDLALDAQMLREVLQGMPTGQTPVPSHQHHQHHHHQLPHPHHAASGRSQPSPMPGLQLLFASPLNASDPTHATLVPGFYSSAMALASTSGEVLCSPPMSVVRTDRTSTGVPDPVGLPSTGAGSLSSTCSPLAHALPRKKRSSATRICKVDGCTKGIRSRGLCKAHGGGRRCTTPGCTTSDQGGGHCVLHGGGRRCRIEGCKKSAQWRGVCKMHGGARRCRYGQCTKNGQVKQGYCRMHHNLLTEQRQQQEQLQTQQLQHLRQQQLPMGGKMQGTERGGS